MVIEKQLNLLPLSVRQLFDDLSRKIQSFIREYNNKLKIFNN